MLPFVTSSLLRLLCFVHNFETIPDANKYLPSESLHPSQAYTLFIDDSRVSEYNANCAELEDLVQLSQTATSQTKVNWCATSRFGPFKARDFLTLVHNRDLGGAYASVACNVELPSLCPAKQNYVRSQIQLSASFMRPLPGGKTEVREFNLQRIYSITAPRSNDIDAERRQAAANDGVDGARLAFAKSGIASNFNCQYHVPFDSLHSTQFIQITQVGELGGVADSKVAKKIQDGLVLNAPVEFLSKFNEAIVKNPPIV